MEPFPEAACWKACTVLAGAGGSAFPPDKTDWINLLGVRAEPGTEAFLHYLTATGGTECADARRSRTLLALLQGRGGESHPATVPHAFNACGLKTDGGEDYALLCHARGAAAAWRQAVATPRVANASFRAEPVVRLLHTALWHLDQAGDWPYAIELAPPQFHTNFRQAVELALAASVVQNACHGPSAGPAPPPAALGLMRLVAELSGAAAAWARTAIGTALVAAHVNNTDHAGRPIDAIAKQEALHQLRGQAPAIMHRNVAATRWLRLAEAMNGVTRAPELLTFGQAPRAALRAAHLQPVIAALNARYTHGAIDDMSPYF